MTFPSINTSAVSAVMTTAPYSMNAVAPGDSFASNVNQEAHDLAVLPAAYPQGSWVGVSMGFSTAQPTATLEPASTFSELYGYGTSDEVDGSASRFYDMDFQAEYDLSAVRVPWYQNGLVLKNDGTTTTQGALREICRVNIRVDRMLAFLGVTPWTDADTVLVSTTHVITSGGQLNTNVFRVGNSSGLAFGSTPSDRKDPRLMPTNNNMELQVELGGSFASFCPCVAAIVPFETSTFWTSGDNGGGGGNNAHEGNGGANLEIGVQWTHSSYAGPSGLAWNGVGYKAGKKATGGGQEAGIHLIINGINSADTPNAFAASLATGTPGKSFTVADWAKAIRASVFDRSRPLVILPNFAVENKTKAALKGHFERWADAVATLAANAELDYSGDIYLVLRAPQLHAVTGLSTRGEYETAHDTWAEAASEVAADRGVGFASLRSATQGLWFGPSPDAGAEDFIAGLGYTNLATESGGVLLDTGGVHRKVDNGWSAAAALEFRQFWAAMLLASLNVSAAGGGSSSAASAAAAELVLEAAKRRRDR
jgi:hypothetical protein